jgi:phosphohistidine swiveling domain-containing protein
MMTIPLISIADPAPQTKEYIGGKGWGLWFMKQQGINVPPALVIPTAVCQQYWKDPVGVMAEVEKAIPKIKDYFTGYFGYMPLLSVRSGAPVSMPGMLNTVLNVGLDTMTAPFWVDKLGGDCTTNCGKRLAEMYSDVVLGKKDPFCVVPDADTQLLHCIEAVFKSWNSDLAKTYRKMEIPPIPDDLGTAVALQAMVFGNLNENSGTGVLFTRNMDTGEAKIKAEFVINGQGEDIVAGVKTPLPLEDMEIWNPAIFNELNNIALKLENLQCDAQDIEFTVQDGTLYILQTRDAKRTGQAAVRIALDMLDEGMITVGEVLKRVTARDFDLAKLPILDPSFKDDPTYTGIPACSGIVTGKVVKSSQAAIDCKEPCILVTKETTPEDLPGMHAARGVVTMTGGYTCHAAVNARSINKPCIVGVSVPLEDFPEGTIISMDGAKGRVWFTTVPVIAGNTDGYLTRFTRLLWEQSKEFPIHGTHDAAVLITTASDCLLPINEWVAKTIKQISQAPATAQIYLDTRLDLDDAEACFFGPLTPANHDLEGEFVAALIYALKKLPASVLDRLQLIADVKEETGDLKRITIPDSLESLILASGEIIVEAFKLPSQPAIEKLLALKKDEVQPIQIGKFSEHGKSFVTEDMLIAYTLK